jgi:hypothetical protein
MRSFAAIVLATSLAASSAFAAGADVRAPLAAGKPAGVKNAQMMEGNTLLIVAGVGIIAAGIALSASGDNNTITTAQTSTSTSATTTSTSSTKTSTSTGTTG